jgi:DNA-binding NarL/FixJ family response regulator
MSNLTTMLVDDHTLLREALRRALESEGMKVVAETGDSDQVAQVAESARPDVVVMDIALPGQGGIAATRQLHERLPGLPVVVLSMFADQATVDAAMQAGAVGYLMKDCTTGELVGALRSAASGALAGPPRGSGKATSKAAATGTAWLSQSRCSAAEAHGLTRRELQILHLLANGASNDALGRALFISTKTAKNHLAHIYGKLGAANRTEAVAKAVRAGLVAIG